jgi:hypothetical protein
VSVNANHTERSPVRWFVAASGLTALLLAGWYAAVGDSDPRSQLMPWQFRVLEIQFLLFAASSAISLPVFIRGLALSGRAAGCLAATCVLTAVLVVGVAPRTNRIYFDEHIYQGIAQNMATLKQAQACGDGAVEYGSFRCWRPEYNKQPYGHPYLISLLFRAGGVDERYTHWLNAASAVAFTAAVFLLTTALWRDQAAAGFAALAAATIPQHLLWSATAASEPTAALMAIVAAIAAVHFTAAPSAASALWLGSATAFAMQFRTESILIVPVVGLIVLLFGRHTLKTWPLWWAALMVIALNIVYVQHLLAIRNESWGATGDRTAWEYFWPNLSVNGPYFFLNTRFPALVTALALLGVATSRSKATLVALTYFLLFWGVFLVFYAGSYDYGADVRFALMCHAPVAMLAGVGASRLVGRLGASAVGHTRAIVAVAAVILFAFLSFVPLVRATGEEAWSARADVSFVDQVVASLPPHSVVLTHTPALFHLRGVSALQTWIATLDPEYVRVVLPSRHRGGLYLHWGFWCNVSDESQVKLCRAAMELPNVIPQKLMEYREQSYIFGLYRLDTQELTLKTP